MSEPVSVKILDREFTVGCEPGEHDQLMAAAQLLDTRMREARGSNRTTPIDRVAMLVALNMAHELLQARQSDHSNDSGIGQTLLEMNHKLDTLFETLSTR